MIKAIFIASEHRDDVRQLDHCSVVAYKGISGDRYFDKQLPAGQNISFIASEAINNYNSEQQQNISAIQTRRNIITEGVELNSLIDKEFTVGEVRFKGVELCQPCAPLSKQLANDTISPEKVKSALTDCAGIRATVLTDGDLAVGMHFKLA